MIVADDPEAERDDQAPVLDRERIATYRAIDAQAGSNMLGEVAGAFRRTGEELLEALREACVSRDAAAAGRAAHQLAGCAGTLGAMSLAATCRDLETGLRSGELLVSSPAEDHLRRIDVQFRQVEDALDRLASDGIAQPADGG